MSARFFTVRMWSPHIQIASQLFRASSSTTSSKIDFRALEAKWTTQWAVKEKGQQKSKPSREDYHPLVSLPFSVLGIRKLANCKYNQEEAGYRKEDGIFDKLLEFAAPKDSDRFLKLRRTDKQLQNYVNEYGTDIVRTCLAFRSPSSGPVQCKESDLIQIRTFFESVWTATSLAHASYMFTQTQRPARPEIPDALYEPNSDSLLDYEIDSIDCLVHIPPDEPDRNNDEKVWLAAQKALLVSTKPDGTAVSAKEVEGCLVTLTEEMIRDNDDHSAQMAYHTARILISLIAPFAPCFAEECWVLLHYGGGLLSDEEASTGSEDEDVYNEAIGKADSLEEIESALAEDAEEWGGDYRHLPKKGYPETLPSVFEIPFPIPIERARPRS
ncbi:MAG: hypothetical protein Q9172_002115 [Xanthocarpia lactea]